MYEADICRPHAFSILRLLQEKKHRALETFQSHLAPVLDMLDIESQVCGATYE